MTLSLDHFHLLWVAFIISASASDSTEQPSAQQTCDLPYGIFFRSLIIMVTLATCQFIFAFMLLKKISEAGRTQLQKWCFCLMGAATGICVLGYGLYFFLGVETCPNELLVIAVNIFCLLPSLSTGFFSAVILMALATTDNNNSSMMEPTRTVSTEMVPTAHESKRSSTKSARPSTKKVPQNMEDESTVALTESSSVSF